MKVLGEGLNQEGSIGRKADRSDCYRSEESSGRE